jgi:hypothetical protein
MNSAVVGRTEIEEKVLDNTTAAAAADWQSATTR